MCVHVYISDAWLLQVMIGERVLRWLRSVDLRGWLSLGKDRKSSYQQMLLLQCPLPKHGFTRF